jgi:hypothetical protein
MIKVHHTGPRLHKLLVKSPVYRCFNASKAKNTPKMALFRILPFT